MADKQIRNDDGLSFNKVSDVDNWLKTVGKHFIELSDDNKNRLVHLVYLVCALLYRLHFQSLF